MLDLSSIFNRYNGISQRPIYGGYGSYGGYGGNSYGFGNSGAYPGYSGYSGSGYPSTGIGGGSYYPGQSIKFEKIFDKFRLKSYCY